ncbi:replication initiator protein A [Faecalibacterium prausnitzii]|uniref:replication initiator protein A n=3 Tax=Oscillospiraceae TaxID=216572 RepID=UPI002079DC0B|nr:replication initiator protein A [Faecalibacterium prausnitzii]
MGDLNLLTQLSTCFVLFCDWRIGTHQFYLTTQTPLPPFLPYPRFLLELDLSQTAKMTYALLLDRATLSQKNLWIDERGFVFVIFTICSLAEQLGRSTVSVSSALKELDAAGLIERRRTRFSSPNHIFVKIPNVE